VPDLFVTTQPGPPDGGLPVVLVHGSLDRSSAFARVARRIVDRSVIRYDRRGYGRSIDAGPCSSFTDQVDDLGAVVGGRPAILVGHSLGGVVALAFAATHPALVPAVVAYEAPMPWTDWWPLQTAGAAAMEAPADPADAAEAFMRRMVGDQRWEALPAGTRAQRRAEGVALVAELRVVRPPHGPPYDPAELTMPVIAAHGTESRPHHIEGARRLAALAPHGQLRVVDGAGHGVHLTHPEALAALVAEAAALARSAT
jgi:pimeloyl-ACP methyl ester carboxylesterase